MYIQNVRKQGKGFSVFFATEKQKKKHFNHLFKTTSYIKLILGNVEHIGALTIFDYCTIQIYNHFILCFIICN